MKKYKIQHAETKETLILNEKDLLFEINRDRSENWIPYTSHDVKTFTGTEDALSLTDYALLSIEEEKE